MTRSEQRPASFDEKTRAQYDELSNKELLEEVAALDPDRYPIVERAQAALDQFEEELSE